MTAQGKIQKSQVNLIAQNGAFGQGNATFAIDTNFKIHQKVQKALSLVHLTGIENKLPQEISYGMQKRVSLARTIALEPEVLLFDEPTTGLDPVTTNSVNHLIQELSRKLKTTSIVVSHDMQCALEIADWIIVMDQGKIVDQGSPTELRKSKVQLVKDFLYEVLSLENQNA
jgi:phospholipid/cholesterol/gamma-HCH transport system ATP-binding protein